MEYYVYMMTNKNKNLLYTGITNDLVRRVYEHKNYLDKGSYTDRYNVEYLIYYESTSDVKAAIEREKQIKGWNRKRKDKLVASKNSNWNDLYEKILYIEEIAPKGIYFGNYASMHSKSRLWQLCSVCAAQ